MRKYLFLCASILTLLGLFNNALFAKSTEEVRTLPRLFHSGDISGVVESCSQGEPIEDTLVYIPGHSFMAKTDANGKFRLYNVPMGYYDLMIEIPDQSPFLIGDIRANGERITNLGTLTACYDCNDNADCQDGSYCAKSRGSCDGQGMCKPKPELCTFILKPVCGCDGNTYGNACEAAHFGESVDHEGECSFSDP